MSYIPLSTLARGTQARIEHMHVADNIRQSLMSVGVVEGLDIRVLHEGPFGRDPIAIEIEGHMVAIRRADAAHIMVAVGDRL